MCKSHSYIDDFLATAMASSEEIHFLNQAHAHSRLTEIVFVKVCVCTYRGLRDRCQ